MSTKTDKIYLSDLEVQTIKKDIKNIHLGVYPPNGRVRVAAPLETSDEVIKLLLLSKMPWIKKQRVKFAKQERQTEREYISGESHYFMGKRYILNVIYQNTSPKLDIKRKDRIDLYVRFGTKVERREEILDNFYRHELQNKVNLLLAKWRSKIGIRVDEVKIKKMKTKWGTANQKANRIWINLELAKKPRHCLEYVLVHELVHFLEKNHTVKFQRLMNTFMPQWKQYREELNCSPLGYNDWKC